MKSKIPLFKKKNEELGEEEETELPEDDSDKTSVNDITDLEDDSRIPENKSLIIRLKSKLNSLIHKKEDETINSEAELSEDSSAVDAAAARKKKISRIFQGVIAVGLLVFLASDYIIPTEEDTEVAPVALKPRPRPIKKNVNPPAEEPASPEKTAEGAVKDGTDEQASGETEPVTEPVVADIDTVEALPTETSTAEELVTETPVSDESIAFDPEATVTPFETSAGDVPVVDSTASNTDTVDDSATPIEDENLTDKILQDLEKQVQTTEKKPVIKEYVAPPDYEYSGRGLVYNCTGKHWACVDGPSYLTCEDNSSSLKFLKKKAECYPFNVYESTKGCESMQNRMVSSGAKTDFCKE